MKVIEQLAAEFEVQLVPELRDAFAYALGLHGKVLVTVESYLVHTFHYSADRAISRAFRVGFCRKNFRPNARAGNFQSPYFGYAPQAVSCAD